jgi:hypothetical protein
MFPTFLQVLFETFFIPLNAQGATLKICADTHVGLHEISFIFVWFFLSDIQSVRVRYCARQICKVLHPRKDSVRHYCNIPLLHFCHICKTCPAALRAYWHNTTSGPYITYCTRCVEFLGQSRTIRVLNTQESTGSHMNMRLSALEKQVIQIKTKQTSGFVI